jgi:hypothetical protein
MRRPVTIASRQRHTRVRDFVFVALVAAATVVSLSSAAVAAASVAAR